MPQAREHGPVVLVVEHEEACPPALLGRWLAEAGLAVRTRRPWAGEPLPGPPGAGGGAYDGLVVLGGSMGATDDVRVPWLAPLKGLLREAVAADLPVLGVCLGHQLLAAALGGEVAANPRGQQVGVLDVGWCPEAAHDPLFGPLTATIEQGVQWNHDVVTGLPPGAAALARAAGGELQVARFAPRAWGVQLHPEVDRAIVAAWVGGARADYLERGIDAEAALDEIGAAQADLEAGWAPLGHAFAELLRDPVARATRSTRAARGSR